MPIMLPPQEDQFTWKVSGEYRIRYERRIDRDFKSSTRDNDSTLFQRGRATLDWKYGENLSGTIQYQYAHGLFWKPTKTSSDENSNITQLNVKFKAPEGTWTVGRQKVIVGSERLVGAGEWTNVGRSFDGVRFQTKDWDAFAVRVGHSDPWPPNARLVGIGHSWKNGGTTNVLYKADADATGKVNLTTLDHAQTWKTKDFDIDAEAAYQFGKTKGKDHTAWAVHFGASHAFNKDSKLALELNSASGGGGTNSTHTFDNLYPTNHKFFGIMDLFAWKNNTNIIGTFTTKTGPNVEFKTRLIGAWLNDKKDAWYGASGKAGLKDANGNSGRFLGNEVDFEFTWKRNANESLMVGYGFFAPGGFVKKVTAENTTQHFGHVQYLIKF